ncbi:hypothetical protein FBR02_02685 [Anaerolineae bacterium CFX9]|nr:hypothetical protein [Anaerolineae bacterium CFX9]
MSRVRAILLVLVVVGFGLRLALALSLDPYTPYQHSGGDSGWYLANGYALVSGRIPCQHPLSIGEWLIYADMALKSRAPECSITDVSRLPTPPAYLIFNGVLQVLFSDRGAAVIALRTLQAAFGALLAVCGFVMARRIAGARAGLIAAALFTFSPAFIFEPAYITSESLFLICAAGGLALYVGRLANPNAPRPTLALAAAAVLFGIASLTRAVFLLFPLALAVWWLMIHGRSAWRAALALVLIYSAVVGSWTVYNLARYNRFVIAGEGLGAFFYLGAAGWDDPQVVDQRLQEAGAAPTPDERDFAGAAASAITSDIPGYISRRISELAGAYLQPHGTAYFPGESLRALAAGWWRDDRSPEGLLRLIRGDAFPQKLALYVVHYGALALGMIGIWRARRAWRLSMPLIGLIVYLTLIHLVLLALPRYIFPTMISWYVFAAVAAGKHHDADSRH